MKFEEKFPTLKALPYTEGTLFSDSDIMNTCLDKQRVKEAIKKVYEPIKKELHDSVQNPYAEMLYNLLKELGLEDD